MNHLVWSAVFAMAVVAATGCGGTSGDTSSATNHSVAAATAMAAGDKETALAELTAAINDNPSSWALFQRARIYVDQGKQAEAEADIQKGIEVDPNDADLKWLAAELKKPAAQRFQGRFAKPPSEQR